MAQVSREKLLKIRARNKRKSGRTLDVVLRNAKNARLKLRRTEKEIQEEAIALHIAS